jgi:hypothetical protein
VDIVAAIISFIIGAIIGGISSLVAYWWKTRHDLRVAAAQCLQRLVKIQETQRENDLAKREKVFAEEKHHLGSNLDFYVACIGAAVTRRSRAAHWKTYREMMPILIRGDVDNLDQTISTLEGIAIRNN